MKYRIKYYYSILAELPIYMPQVKSCLWWVNLASSENSSYESVKSEEDALVIINKHKETMKLKATKAHIIDVK